VKNLPSYFLSYIPLFHLQGENTEEFNNTVRAKKSIRKMLKFLQTEKNHVHDGLMKKFPKYEALIVSLMPLILEMRSPLSGDKRFVMLCFSFMQPLFTLLKLKENIEKYWKLKV
jgi:hypothetical protein